MTDIRPSAVRGTKFQRLLMQCRTQLASTARARSRCRLNSSIVLALAVVTASERAVVVAEMPASEMPSERPAMVAAPVEPGEGRAATGPAALPVGAVHHWQPSRALVGARSFQECACADRS